MTEQPKALRLADALDRGGYDAQMARNMDQAAAELRRLHAVNVELVALLKEVSEETRHPDYDWTIDLAQRVSAAIAKAEQQACRAALNFVHQALQAEASISYVQSDAETYGLEEPKP